MATEIIPIFQKIRFDELGPEELLKIASSSKYHPSQRELANAIFKAGLSTDYSEQAIEKDGKELIELESRIPDWIK